MVKLSAAEHNQHGIASSRLGKLDVAIVEYNQAIRLKPDYAPAYLNRGLALMRLGEHTQAAADFSRVLALEKYPKTRRKAEHQLRALLNNPSTRRDAVHGMVGNPAAGELIVSALDAAAAEVADARERVKARQDEAQSIQHTLTERVSILTQQRDRLRDQAGNLEARMKQHGHISHELQTLEMSVERRRAELARLRDQVVTVQAELEMVQGEVEDMAKNSKPATSPGSRKESVEDHWVSQFGRAATPTDRDSPPTYPIRAKVVGVTHEGRQDIVAQLSVGESLWLRREPLNRFDRNAIRVERLNGEQVGYLPRAMAEQLAQPFDSHGSPVEATVAELVGGHAPGMSLGVRIQFVVPQT